jgi:hypothetical protein
MLGVARRRLEGSGLTNVTFEQGDTQVHPLPVEAFDVALSRFGTMFFVDATAAFANVRTALRAGGRIAFATWQPLAANDWLTVPANAVVHFGAAPPVTDAGPGMFGQSDPAVIESTLQAAGFDRVEVTPARVTLWLGDAPRDAAAHVGDSGIGRMLLDAIPEDDRDAALAAIEAAFTSCVTDDGVQLDGAIFVTTARRRG